MNIFYLDQDPIQCAQMHNDKHVVKMILEYAQLLCTAHRVIDGEMWNDKTANGSKIKRWKLADASLEEQLYKATHVNHPSNIWARESLSNYKWLYDLFVATCKEYTHRYGKTHATETKLKDILKNAPKNIEDKGMTLMPQAMPDYCKDKDPIQGYRTYYIKEKKGFNNYTNRQQPVWLR